MFRIKICGITNVEDAITATDSGADAIGLNMYDHSPRRISSPVAKEVTAAIFQKSVAGPFTAPPLCVGVFVNAARETIQDAVHAASLQAIQLHGDEPPELLGALTEWKVAEIKDLAGRFEQRGLWKHAAILRKATIESSLPVLIRARRFDARGVAAVHEDLESCRNAGGPPAAVLIDACTPGRYGGTGETVSWVGLADHPRWLGETPLVLAGGLTPDNVAEAIRIVRPAAVDVASGVESAPGKKDPHKVRDFIAAAKAAFGIS